MTANYSYLPNLQDKRLQQIKNQASASVLLSQFDYTYDAEGQLKTWTKNYPGLTTPQRYDLSYDNADQLLSAPLKKTTNNALIRQYTYGYDFASNRPGPTMTSHEAMCFLNAGERDAHVCVTIFLEGPHAGWPPLHRSSPAYA